MSEGDSDRNLRSQGNTGQVNGWAIPMDVGIAKSAREEKNQIMGRQEAYTKEQIK